MTGMHLHKVSANFCRKRYFLFSFVWCLSIGLGALLSIIMRTVTVSLMYIAPMCRVSIVGLVMILLFPLLLSAAAVKFSIPSILYLIAFLNGMSLGYFMLGLIIAFHSAGWLMGVLLGFSQLLNTILRLWFFYKCLSGTCEWTSWLICCCAAVVTGLLDYCVVSPYLVTFMA